MVQANPGPSSPATPRDGRKPGIPSDTVAGPGWTSATMWGGMAALPVALLVASLVEAARVPWSKLGLLFFRPAAIAHAAGTMQLELIGRFPLLALLMVSAVAWLALQHRVPRSWAWLIWAACTAGLAIHAYDVLIAYPRFRGYAPFVAVSFGLWLVWLVTLGPWRPRPSLRFGRPAAIIVSGCSGVGAAYIHCTRFQGFYPSLHLALLIVTVVSAFATLTAIVNDLPRSRRIDRSVKVIALGLGGVSLLLAAVSLFVPLPAPLLSYVRTYSVLGSADGAVFLSAARNDPAMAASEARCAPVLRSFNPEEADQVFDANAGLPPLPGELDLRRYNVLYVLIESTRYDQTGLANPALDNTPTLVALRERGAFSFSRAYTPSTFTLQVVSSLLAMRLPEHTPVDVEEASWIGTLPDGVDSVAELFSRSGWETFHVFHAGISRCCRDSFSQGFAHRHFVGARETFLDRKGSAEKEQRGADVMIADQAIDSIQASLDAGQRFFGLVFLYSPHAPYWARKPGNWSAIERYRQEIGNADHELGRVLAALEAKGAMDNTVVIVAGDHGEEFGEHGAEDHGRSVYMEVKHVPLLIWIPGLQGTVQGRPTSLAYVLPWLLRRGTPEMRVAARTSLVTSLAPVMDLTGGGTPIELRGAYGVPEWVSLTYADASIGHNLRSGLTEVFSLKDDPLEQHNLIERGDPGARWLRDAMDRYLLYRRCSGAARPQ